MYEPWRNWPARWEAALRACERLGGESQELLIEPPASEAEVETVEAKLGLRLPDSFRTVLLEFSSHTEVLWSLPEDLRRPNQFREMFRGELCWNLGSLTETEKFRHGWIEDCFPDPDDPEGAVWHDKLSFLEVGNGDQLAINTKAGEPPFVAYLAHELDYMHGYRLGHDFVDFVDRWSLLGCPGPEHVQFLPFVEDPTSGINPEGENASLWRRWFGLEF